VRHAYQVSGGGPAGLYFGLLATALIPHDICAVLPRRNLRLGRSLLRRDARALLKRTIATHEEITCTRAPWDADFHETTGSRWFAQRRTAFEIPKSLSPGILQRAGFVAVSGSARRNTSLLPPSRGRQADSSSQPTASTGKIRRMLPLTFRLARRRPKIEIHPPGTRIALTPSFFHPFEENTDEQPSRRTRKLSADPEFSPPSDRALPCKARRASCQTEETPPTREASPPSPGAKPPTTRAGSPTLSPINKRLAALDNIVLPRDATAHGPVSSTARERSFRRWKTPSVLLLRANVTNIRFAAIEALTSTGFAGRWSNGIQEGVKTAWCSSENASATPASIRFPSRSAWMSRGGRTVRIQ
jgi:hypothetical protein